MDATGVGVLRQQGVEAAGESARTLWFLKQILPHEPALRAWLARHAAAGIDVDDIIQESYAVFASMERFREVRNPRAYLFQVAHSQVVRHIRRERVVSIMAVEDLGRLAPVDPGQGPEQQAIGHDELRRLAEVIAAMPDKTREAFVLRRVRGLSQRAIAERMRISESTVEKHIARGIRHVADSFADGGNCSAGGSRTQAQKERRADAARDKPRHR